MKQIFCRRFKKSVSAVLAAAMSISVFTSVPASAENNGVSTVGKTTYTYDDYYVEYYVTDAWEGSQNVELTVYNTGDESILNWALKYDAQGEISNLWNAGIYEQNDSEYVIRNVDWNFEIAPNQCVMYGYKLTGDDISLPEKFEICSKRVDVTENYDVTYNITNEWDTGVQGEIVITNYDDTPLEAWTLIFDSNFAVIDLWNGRVLENNGTSYTIAAEVWTNPVQPNSSMTIGFTGTKEAGTAAVLDNFRLTEVAIDEGNGTVTPVDPPVEDEEIEITANAAYDEENNNITVSWTSNNQDGTFDILMSADGENFTSVGTVSGVSEYVYTPESDFETLYFKVVQTVGTKSAESNVVTVLTDEEDDYIDDVMSWDEMVDTDGDGLPDYIEEHEYGTDINNPDTDGDGLPDGYEVLNCGTDPALFDSDGNGISDADEDLDGDGLSNIEEYRLGTAPIVKDSDNDGLSDGEEVNIHNTDPLVYDSDSDGICDGDEIIKGLNPNNPTTFGVPDSEYTFEQVITADNDVFHLINYDENPFELSLKLNAAGNAENSIAVSKSGYSIIMDNESILGCVPEINYDKNLKVNNIEISFVISQEYLIEPYSAFDNGLTGLHKYNIFTYNEDMNMLMPIATEYDEANSRIYTNVENIGTYFIVDMNKWVSQLGIKSNSEPARMTAYSLSENSDEESEYIDVAFLIYNTQRYSSTIKDELTTTIEEMYSRYDKIRVFFVIYSGDSYVCGLTGERYAETAEEAKNIINRLTYTTSIGTLTMYNGLNAIPELEWRENSQRYCFIIDALVEPLCQYNMPAFNAIPESGITTAICYNIVNDNADIYKSMTTNAFSRVVAIDRVLIPLINFPEGMIMSTNLMPVELDKEINKKYIDAADDLWYNEDRRVNYSDFADTDNDGLYDFEEINFDTELISFDSNDKVKLPTFAECLAATDNTKIMTAMDIYADESFYEKVMNKNILLVNSDPTSEDGDGDGILDFDEVAIIKEELRNSASAISTFSAATDSDGDGIPDYVEKKNKGILDCTRKDTVKSIFESIAGSNKVNMSKSSNYTWITFDDINDENHITLNVRLKYNEKLFNDNGTEDKKSNKPLTVNTANKIAPDSKTDLYNTIMHDQTVTSNATAVDISELMSIADVEVLKQDQINTLRSDFIERYNKTVEKLNEISKKNKRFIDNNTCGIKSTTTMKDLFIKSIKQHWEMSDEPGTEYDFYPGMKVSFSVALKQYNENNGENNGGNNGENNGGNYVNVFFNVNKCGHSSVSDNSTEKLNGNSDSKCIKIMNIYQSTCDNTKKDSNGNIIVHSKFDDKCSFYYIKPSPKTIKVGFKTIEEIYDTYAHEFGHVAGLADAYESATCNEGFEPLEQAEVAEKEMMNDNKNVSLNDIEMILYKHADDSKKEYYVPRKKSDGKTYKLSKAFRAPYIIFKDSKDNYYYYDTLNCTDNPQKIGNNVAYSFWKSKIGEEKDALGQKYKGQSWFKQLP